MTSDRRPVSERCCWPWSHQWSKWTMFERGELHRPSIAGAGYRSESTSIVGKYETQRRECSICGKSQLRETRA